MENMELTHTGLKKTDRNMFCKNYRDIFEILFVLVFSLILLLIFSFSTSPLYSTFGNDGLEYKLAGSAILDGLVMFRDIFHQKGALFFFVEAIGEALCRLFNNEKLGTFLLQYINLTAVLLLVLKTEKLYLHSKSLNDKEKKLFKISIFFAVAFFWMATFHLGNQVEEYTLIYEFAAIYISIKYCLAAEDKEQNLSKNFKAIYGFVLGLCFAAAFWYKPTTAVVIGACVLFIGVHMLINKNFSMFWRCVFLGAVGIAAITVPLMIYYYANNALSDLINECFLFNLGYIKSLSFLDTSVAILIKKIILQFGFPVAALVLAILLHFNLTSVLCLVMAVSNMIMFFLTSTAYVYYFEVQTPVFLVMLFAFVGLNIPREKLKTTAIIGVLTMALIYACTEYTSTVICYEKSNIDYWQQLTNNVDKFKKGTENIFTDDNNKDILFVENEPFIESRYFYYHMKRYPFSNLFSLDFFNRIGSSYYIDKFYEEFENMPPEYIVISNDRKNINEVYDEVVEKAETEYTTVYSDNTYTLYELK